MRCSRRPALCVAVLMALTPCARPGAQTAAGDSARGSPLWGGLQPGPYAVGFRVVHTHDYARGYWPRTDFRGARAAEETARPMQISLWYPARAALAAPRMPFGAYIGLLGTELGARRDSAARQRAAEREYRRGPLAPHFPQGGVPDSAWRRILATPTAAVRDAAPLAGPFPVVLHPGIGGGSAQSVLLEYLASHGYVVASVPLLNTGPAWHGRGEWTAAALQSQAADLGFVLGWLRAFPGADYRRAAVVGMGAHAGVLLQMRGMQLDAIVVRDGRYPDELRLSPDYDLTRMRIPLLDIPNDEFPRDTAMLDSMRYARRILVRIPDARHVDFYQFRRIAHPDRASEHAAYEISARFTRRFLDAVLGRDTAALASLRDLAHPAGGGGAVATVRVLEPMPPAPTEGELLTLVRENVDEAVRAYRDARAREPTARLFSEQAMTTVARFLGRDAGPDAAAKAFEILVDAYPASVQARSLLAGAYAQSGQGARAITELETALRLLAGAGMPESDRARWERSLRADLARLRPP